MAAVEEEEDEQDFAKLVSKYTAAMERKYGKDIAALFKESLNELFEDLEFLEEDLDFDIDDWGNSCLMDDLNQNREGFEDESFCKTFFGILKQIVKNGGAHDDALLPTDLDWNVTKNDVKKAQEYMHQQCPGGGTGSGVFAHAEENRALYRTVAVGRKNEIQLLSLITEVFELSLIDNIVRKQRKFRDHSHWKTECKFFSKHKKAGEMLINAIAEFNKRIAGGGPAGLIMNPIQDDINVYVEYTMMMSKVVRKVIDTANAKKQTVCPFQLDLVICGRKQQKEDDGDDNKEDEEEDDDDDDDIDLPAQLSLSMGSFAPMVNQIEAPIQQILQRGKIKFESLETSVENEARTLRGLNEKIQAFIGNDSHKRIIVLVDRMDPEKPDTVYIYQTGNPQQDVIRKDYNELHMVWKTKTALIPNYKKPDDEINPLIGASIDFGDNSFVFSFHVHAEDFVKCDQWIKTQKSPFLPYHICKVWPMYFNKKSKELDDKYTMKYIYDNWALPVEDKATTKWIQAIDPKFYEMLQKDHLRYIK